MTELIHEGFNEKNINIIKNTTTWNNEIIQHKISLIPVFNANNYLFNSKFEINEINTNENVVYITSDQLKIVEG